MVGSVTEPVMVRDLPPQAITAPGGHWDMLRTRFHAAQEPNSFLGIPEINVPREENRHWAMVSEKVRGRHCAKKRNSHSIAEHCDIVPPEKCWGWDKVRRCRHIVMGIQSPRSLGSSSTGVAVSSRKVVPAKTEDGSASRRWPVSEPSELDAPRWKQAWLHRKNSGSWDLPSAWSEPAPAGLPSTLKPRP